MIKLFMQLVAIHSVLCAPGVPFLRYGVPSGSGGENVENAEPWSDSETAENLPGSRNLNAKSQLPVNLPGTRNHDEKSIPDSVTRDLMRESLPIVDLPGTRNLEEKSIPDSITLRKIPVPLNDLELPRYVYQGGFAGPEATPNYEEPKVHQELPAEQQQDQTAHALYPIAVPQQKETLYPNAVPEQKDQTPYALYPNAVPDEVSGSEIKETEISLGSNPPQNSVQVPPSAPEVPPGSSISVQDIKGQYSHGFSNPDGTQIEESGHLISTDDGWEYVIAKEGSYRYLSPEGIPINVRYIADENGFRILSQSFAGR